MVLVQLSNLIKYMHYWFQNEAVSDWKRVNEHTFWTHILKPAVHVCILSCFLEKANPSMNTQKFPKLSSPVLRSELK